ncbi:GIY-YIG nuclease family protein [Microbacterium sp. NPDC057659]|uniref:GIY-YIG nuclease family protein n=1 Tax=Microbacterium sp. NPDC057659 TaxID=3346198 RepID=UPI00366E5907
MPHVYILKCSDGSLYTGSTWNLEHRLAQHEFGEGGDYTRRRRPVELVWSAEFARVDEAYGWERESTVGRAPRSSSSSTGSTRRSPDGAEGSVRRSGPRRVTDVLRLASLAQEPGRLDPRSPEGWTSGTGDQTAARPGP